MRPARWSSLLLILVCCVRCNTVSDIGGLPLVVIAPPHPGTTLAVIVSGDGGWRAIDRQIAAGLRARGCGVVGLVAPRFFAQRRTPDQAAEALQQIVAHYATEWDATRVIAVGYSRGAGVLPFMVNRMTPKWRDRVTMLALMGLDPTIDFEVRPFDFLRRRATPAEVPVRSEVERVGKRILCFYGDHEKDSLCRDLPASVAVAIAEPGGHHFDVNSDDLARTIWNWSRL
jgi:type IV secretory pathway VirJ component